MKNTGNIEGAAENRCSVWAIGNRPSCYDSGMGTGPPVSVIVPCYGHAELLPRLLEALEAQETSLDFEVLVVESGGDEAARRVGGRFPRVRVLSHGRRLFPGAARNRGAAAQGECLAFVDADAVPEPRWLETLHARLRSSERISMVSGWVGLPPGVGPAGEVLHLKNGVAEGPGADFQVGGGVGDLAKEHGAPASRPLPGEEVIFRGMLTPAGERVWCLKKRSSLWS